jgi:predicted Zn-dependent peptidase
MAKFQSWDDGRFHVHVWSNRQFQTRFVNIKCVRRMRRDDVTSTAVLPYLWLEGTEHYPDAKALLRRADDLFGTVLRTGIGKRADRHVAELYAALPEPVHTDDPSLFDETLALVLEVLTAPARDGAGFVPAHVERQRHLHRRRIEGVFDDKIAYAMERCAACAFDGHPAGLPRLGFEQDLDGLTPASLWQTHTQLLAEGEVHVYVVGQVDDPAGLAGQLLDALRDAFGARPEAPAPPVAAVAPREDRDGAREHIEEQPIHQGKLNLAWRTGVGMASPEYPALLVATGILGGFPHSKLFLNVREKASLAYYASARLDALTGVVFVQTGIEPKNKGRALDIILAQVRALQAGEIRPEELDYTKRGLRNQYLQLLDQPMSMADVHFTGVLAGVVREPDDWIKAVEAVTLDQVVAAARRMRLDTVYFLHGSAEGGATHG